MGKEGVREPTDNERLGFDRRTWDGGCYFSMYQYRLLPGQMNQKSDGAKGGAAPTGKKKESKK